LPNKRLEHLNMTTRLRHRPQLEDEDASALKLGAGVLSLTCYRVSS
jgi:hypothetical protein